MPLSLSMAAARLASKPSIERAILLIRGQRVLLDQDLAALYGVATRELVQAVKRNIARFPADFMFQLDAEDFAGLRSQIVISKPAGRGGRRTAPYAFTEQGVAMLSSVLHSTRAIQVNVEIMRAFVRLRQLLQSNAELARKLALLEKRYDAQFRVVFDAIRDLMGASTRSPRQIGFRHGEGF
jgi:ORF6N domain